MKTVSFAAGGIRATRFITVAILLLLFSVAPAIKVAAQTISWSPYVTKLTTTSAAINWRGGDQATGTVEYATATYYNTYQRFEKTIASPNPSGAYQHVPLTGLEPNTSYIYRVRPSDNPNVFSNRTFRTMPVSGPFTFIVISDAHAQDKRFKYVADAIVTYETDALFVLDGGDYANYDDETLWTPFFQYGDGVFAKFPLFTTIGNHEYHDPSSGATGPTAAVQYHSSFDIPANGHLNYSFDCSGVRFIILNSPNPDNPNDENPSLALSQSQAPWLEALLKESMQGVFTIHHHPIWRYGRATSDSALEPWETLYHTYPISANFAGHIHNYERHSVQGIPYFVVGNAGGKFEDMNPGDPCPPGYKVGATRQLGYLKVTVDPANNTATAQEFFVAWVETDTSETATVHDPPVLFDTITFPLSPQSSPVYYSSGDSGGCFIATAAFGSYLHPAVKPLRDFRDKFLITNHYGRSFVTWYYKTSPPLADFIRTSVILKTLARIMLLPAVLFACLCLKIGVLPTLLVLLLTVAGSYLLITLIRGKNGRARILFLRGNFLFPLLAVLIISGCSSESTTLTTGFTLRTSSPQVLFSTYLGGSRSFVSYSSPYTFAQNTASDGQGNSYVTGATRVSDLPVTGNAYQSAPAAGSHLSAFVAKYDPTGKILWCTYLGGNNKNMGTGIAAMPDGGVVIVGFTSSDSAGPFPAMNPCQPSTNGLTDYFVAVFAANGTLRYSTYLGGSGVEGDSTFSDDNSNGNNVSVDAQGLVYLTGTTNSAGTGNGATQFPLTPNAQQPVFGGNPTDNTDAFLAIIDPSKSGSASLVYASFLGGKTNEKGHGVAVNASGGLISVAGYTDSIDFPTTGNAYRNSPPPSGWHSNGYITQFVSSVPGSPSSHYTLGYSTYLGGNSAVSRDDTYGITLTSDGLIVATGRTQSVDFPMLDSTHPSIYNSAPNPTVTVRNDQPYLVKINPSLSKTASLVYATFLGGGSTTGGGGAFGTSVAVDSSGSTYVGGETGSQGVQFTPSSIPVVAPELFPYTQDALFTTLRGSFDALLMQISPDGATLTFSTFFGGSGTDRAYGLALDPSGNIVLSGLTSSANFPVVNAAQTWPGNSGYLNAFIAKFGR